MAENDVLDSGQATGTAGTPTPPSSSGAGDQQSSLDAEKLQSTLEAIAKRLDEVDARSKSLQGDKDRGVNKTKKEVDELKRQIAEIEKLKKTGLNEDGAIEEFSFREDVRSLKEQLSKLNPTSPQAAGNGASGAVEQAQVISDLKLDANSPDVISIFAKGLDPDKQELELRRLAAREKQPPSPASATTLVGQPATHDNNDVGPLIAELDEWQKTPSKYRAQIAQRVEELEKRGWK